MTNPLNPSPKLAPNYGEGWDAEQDDALASLAARGFSRKEAAVRMGRTYMAIKGRSQALGLRFIRDTDAAPLRAYDSHAFQEMRATMEASDRRMVRALAEAIYRGDHLPGASL